jgi:crotonobetainyl-CoA:carnitine CoA-transferase CaiB-like acyl-CoA transferase
MQEVGVLVPFENGKMLTIDSPFFAAGATKAKPRKAPAVGEHSEQILREAGYDDAPIAGMRESKIVA